MSNLAFFIRFSITYMLIMAVAGITLGLLQVENASSINTPIFLALSYWFFYSYSNKNSRIIQTSEKWKLICLALAGDFIVSILLGIPTMLANEIPLEYLLIGMAIVMPMHFLLLIAVNFGVKKQILKQRPELMKS